MKIIFKNLIAFMLPVIVLVLIPCWIEKNLSVKYITTFIMGLVIILSGLYILFLTISSFIKIGKGTLAPWSPARKLVITGLYRYVRNPMILGVLIILTGESIAILSFKILAWAIIFFILNTVYFLAYEEPGLEKRFGEEYKDYKKHVPRWLPSLKPYNPVS